MTKDRPESPAAAPRRGERDLVVVANRLPVRRTDDGLRTSPGGLVAALLPALHAAGGGAWVGWAGGDDALDAPFDHDGVRCIPVPVSAEELEGHYEGISNAAIWPLYHDLVRPPRYQRVWWPAYEAVNRRFAEAAAEDAADGAVVWVHDYQLHLVPAMLRELRPDLRIGFFLHIPFPGRGLFAQLPWRRAILEGTLGADVVGFQTAPGAANFAELACRYAGAEPGVRAGEVVLDGRTVAVRAFPISTDFAKFDRLATEPAVVERARGIRRRLGGRRILLGVDRLDYTKGIDIRLRAYGDLLARGLARTDEVVLVQSAVPTREDVSDYANLRSTVEELVGHINGDFGRVGLSAIQYLRQNLPEQELAALYVAADVMLVTPYRDGMNLVAKEFVASKHDERGVLVLSEFTGAAHDLVDAVQVNPHDLDGLVHAIDRALKMPGEEVERRMHRMREQVRTHDVHAWARSFLDALRGAGGAPGAAAGVAATPDADRTVLHPAGIGGSP